MSSRAVALRRRLDEDKLPTFRDGKEEPPDEEELSVADVFCAPTLFASADFHASHPPIIEAVEVIADADDVGEF